MAIFVVLKVAWDREVKVESIITLKLNKTNWILIECTPKSWHILLNFCRWWGKIYIYMVSLGIKPTANKYSGMTAEWRRINVISLMWDTWKNCNPGFHFFHESHIREITLFSAVIPLSFCCMYLQCGPQTPHMVCKSETLKIIILYVTCKHTNAYFAKPM